MLWNLKHETETEIYHIPKNICEFSKAVTLTNLIEKLESVQYSAALAVTGVWKGTSRQKIYGELGWESPTSDVGVDALFFSIISSII